MLKLTERLPKESSQFTDELLLPFDERKRGRLKAITVHGQQAGIFIERGDVMRDGTLLRSECGEVVRITAADENVTTAYSADPLTFSRACYHLGNRHVPLQIGDKWLRYQVDHVLDEMVILLGLELHHEQAPFEPENGAYAKGHSHHNSHDHGHGHGHGHHEHHH